MKKLIYIFVIVLVLTSWTTESKCQTTLEWLSKEGNISLIVKKDRSKLPWMLQKYQAENEDLISITLDSLVITAGLNVCSGFYYSTWKFKKAESLSYINYDWDDVEYYYYEKKLLIEVTNIKASKGYTTWSTSWPAEFPFK